ncbi:MULTISPECIES: DUF1493 family protein [Burkholderia]|uniref:Acyl carrier protein n=1 Tax=Burkholderia aenigmatica TaxID=2015348 RepID=A0A228IYV3_9BURK|nr:MULTISPECIES: DUF1493 family protein [Burkholderia]MBN3843400.1 DUF1493 family protein [Burkholderia sp. Ac-20349]OXI47319.1 acyl carrier protein [Burkholderia aenigmatica]
MTDTAWGRLEAFAREELGRPLFGGPLKLSQSSRMEEDLRITGIDAIEFIDKWGETFGIDIEHFPYQRYIGPETLDMVRTFLGLLSSKYRDPERVPLTLGMLEEAMRLGRWDTDAIERFARDATREE